MTARVGDTRGKTERLSGERAWAQPGWQRHGGHADAGYRLGRVRARARGRESARGSHVRSLSAGMEVAPSGDQNLPILCDQVVRQTEVARLVISSARSS